MRFSCVEKRTWHFQFLINTVFLSLIIISWAAVIPVTPGLWPIFSFCLLTVSLITRVRNSYFFLFWFVGLAGFSILVFNFQWHYSLFWLISWICGFGVIFSESKYALPVELLRLGTILYLYNELLSSSFYLGLMLCISIIPYELGSKFSLMPEKREDTDYIDWSPAYEELAQWLLRLKDSFLSEQNLSQLISPVFDTCFDILKRGNGLNRKIRLIKKQQGETVFLKEDEGILQERAEVLEELQSMEESIYKKARNILLRIENLLLKLEADRCRESSVDMELSWKENVKDTLLMMEDELDVLKDL